MLELLINPVFWTVAAALIGASLVVNQIWSRRSTQRQGLEALKEQGHSRENEYWEAALTCARDRRHKHRRYGKPLAVHFRLSEGSPTHPAFVLDRSTGGVRLATEQPVKAGTYIFIVADQAPVGTPWAEAVVSWSKQVYDRHELGCHFVGNVPWNVMLLFG